MRINQQLDLILLFFYGYQNEWISEVDMRNALVNPDSLHKDFFSRQSVAYISARLDMLERLGYLRKKTSHIGEGTIVEHFMTRYQILPSGIEWMEDTFWPYRAKPFELQSLKQKLEMAYKGAKVLLTISYSVAVLVLSLYSYRLQKSQLSAPADKTVDTTQASKPSTTPPPSPAPSSESPSDSPAETPPPPPSHTQP